MESKSPSFRPKDYHNCPPPNGLKPNPHLSILVLTIGVVGAAVLLVAYLIFVKKFYENMNNSPRRIQVTDQPRAATPDEEDREEFVGENQGPVLDHPMWYIRTVGLQQSVIESIAVFKYKRAEGLIEGTDCSVCLNEFQEDETLRLLPKCSHAFHIPCIDTWLRSHKNCPLCRAPIVRDLNINARSNAQTEPILDDVESREATRSENLETSREDATSETAEFPTEERVTPPINEILPKDSHFSNRRNCELRVSSDLVGRHPKVVEEESQPVRRSVSMDESSASAIYHAVAELERGSSTQLVQAKKPNSEIAAKGRNRNSSFYRVVKSCSFGPSLQKGSVSMKRSLSSMRYSSRNRDPILPL